MTNKPKIGRVAQLTQENLSLRETIQAQREGRAHLYKILDEGVAPLRVADADRAFLRREMSFARFANQNLQRTLRLLLDRDPGAAIPQLAPITSPRP